MNYNGPTILKYFIAFIAVINWPGRTSSNSNQEIFIFEYKRLIFSNFSLLYFSLSNDITTIIYGN